MDHLVWMTPLGHVVFPEVVLLRSRHAIHRGVRETRPLRRHTHLPSTRPLLCGGRPALNFAQQPGGVVGDVVLWCSTALWHTSGLFFQPEILIFWLFQTTAKRFTSVSELNLLQDCWNCWLRATLAATAPVETFFFSLGLHQSISHLYCSGKWSKN